ISEPLVDAVRQPRSRLVAVDGDELLVVCGTDTQCIVLS
ncbi:MAG: hypothetical protein J07HX64_00788, partial [halophilic archaeon J07HX64]